MLFLFLQYNVHRSSVNQSISASRRIHSASRPTAKPSAASSGGGGGALSSACKRSTALIVVVVLSALNDDIGLLVVVPQVARDDMGTAVAAAFADAADADAAAEGSASRAIPGTAPASSVIATANPLAHEHDAGLTGEVNKPLRRADVAVVGMAMIDGRSPLVALSLCSRRARACGFLVKGREVERRVY